MQSKNRLREFRERSRLTLAEVGTLMGLDLSMVSKHEAGTRSLTADQIIKYAKIFKCETHELFVIGQVEAE